MTPISAAIAAELVVIIGILIAAAITVNGHSIFAVMIGWVQ